MIGPLDSFVWGSGGAQLTPTQIDAQRKVAQALMAQGSDYSPVQSWTQGASRVAQAIFGGMQARDANEAAKSNQSTEAQLLASLMPGGTPVSTASTPSPIATPMGRTSIPASTSGKIYANDEPSPLDPPSGADRQAMVQTILGEAADQGPVGQQAVASVIRNRAVNGGYGGDTPQGVVQAPNQFEPWNTQAGRNRMAAAASNPAQAAQADAAIALAYGEGGNAPADPTNGATHFYGPKVQAALGRRPPSWDNGTGVDIGGHRFFGGAPQQPVQVADASNDPAALPVNAQPTQGFAIPGQPQAAPSVNPGLMRAMASPYISDGTKKILGLVLTQQMEAAQKATDPLRQLQIQEGQAKLEALPLQRRGQELANQKIERELQGEGATPLTPEERASFGIPQGQSAYKTRRGEIKFGPAGTNITTNVGAEAPDGQLRKKLDEQTAKNWGAWQEAGHVSAGQVQDLQMLDELIKVAPQGPLTGRLAEMMPGVSSAGDAFNAIVKRVAPTMRAPGSGSTSDIEYDGMLRSLPALRNKPEANIAISEMMKAKSAVNIERADIISQYSQNQISRNDAEKRLGEINKRSIMTPALRQMLAGLGGKGDVPLAGDVVDGYRFKGGDPANQASWEKAQ